RLSCQPYNGACARHSSSIQDCVVIPETDRTAEEVSS
ncbi:hypothetical protein JMJ77_0002051, partial [Colletotrichum scovillei]